MELGKHRGEKCLALLGIGYRGYEWEDIGRAREGFTKELAFKRHWKRLLGRGAGKDSGKSKQYKQWYRGL